MWTATHFYILNHQQAVALRFLHRCSHWWKDGKMMACTQLQLRFQIRCRSKCTLSCALFLVTNMYTFSMHVANPVILHNSTNMIRTKKQTYRFVQKERNAPEYEKQQFSLTMFCFWSMTWHQMWYSDSADTKIRWDLYPTGLAPLPNRSCASVYPA